MKKILLIGTLLPDEQKYAGRSDGFRLRHVWFSPQIPRHRKVYLEALETAGEYDGVIIDESVCKEGFSIEALELAMRAIGEGVKYVMIITSHKVPRYSLWRYENVLQQLAFVGKSRKLLINSKSTIVARSPSQREIVRQQRLYFPRIQAVKNWPEIFGLLFPVIPSVYRQPVTGK